MMPHYVPRRVAEIKEKDSFVSLIGKVVEVDENFLVLEDTTGRIEIIAEKTADKNSIIRVFCSRAESGWKADVVQDLSGINLEIFEKVEEAFRAANQ